MIHIDDSTYYLIKRILTESLYHNIDNNIRQNEIFTIGGVEDFAINETYFEIDFEISLIKYVKKDSYSEEIRIEGCNLWSFGYGDVVLHNDFDIKKLRKIM